MFVQFKVNIFKQICNRLFYYYDTDISFKVLKKGLYPKNCLSKIIMCCFGWVGMGLSVVKHLIDHGIQL